METDDNSRVKKENTITDVWKDTRKFNKPFKMEDTN